MRRFVLITMTFALWGLLALPVAAQGTKDDVKKDKVPAKKDDSGADREARIKAMLEQMTRLQHQLAEEGIAPGVGGAGFAAGRPLGIPDQEEMQKQMLERTRAFRDSAGNGPGSFHGIPAVPPGFSPLNARVVDPNSMMLQQLQQMSRMVDMGEPGGAAGAGEEVDPLAMGRRMVITALEFQLRGVAERIRATEDKEAKEELTKDFKETVAKIVEAREKHREKSIQRLEKRLAALKDHKDESADAILNRLLEGGQPAAEKSDAADADKK